MSNSKRLSKDAFARSTVLINPNRYPKKAQYLKKKLKIFGVYKVLTIGSKEGFIQSVKEFQRGNHNYLLIWGGDGTVNQTINALMQNDDNRGNWGEKSIGFFRGGSGNGYHDSYDVPVSISKQLHNFAESMDHGYTVKVDLLKIQGDYHARYGQLFGIGFAVDVLKKRNVKESNGYRQVRPGLLNYVLSTIITFSKLKKDFYKEQTPFKMEIFDGKRILENKKGVALSTFQSLGIETRAPMIEIGKRPFYGNRFKVCPGAVCNDGLMDLFLYEFNRKLPVLVNMPLLWRGKYQRINSRLEKKSGFPVVKYKIKKIFIQSESAFDYHIDGELIPGEWKKNNSSVLSISVVPKAISFLVPGVFYRKLYPIQ
jgi:diacylglycerol kinase family enzyme